MWSRVIAINREKGHHFEEKFFHPNDHSSEDSRVANYAKKLTDYSTGLVTVQGSTVYINKKVFFVAQAAYGQYPQERAYLVAGKLARIFHNVPRRDLTTAAFADDTSVCYATYEIVCPAENEEEPAVLAERLNNIIQTL